MLESFFEAGRDVISPLFESDFAEAVATSAAEGWVTQVLEFPSKLALELFILLAEARGFTVVILAIAATAAGFVVTLSLRPKKSGPTAPAGV